ncbi:hypothetical protein I4F81_000219 [Pyropia yezoensis]|uniref:Uncharacterized protein n=1 Tax=Pyropia yezoensis TaxID=2788 RepID=A0ACC3BI96_PYRYE|nr:hypothetical protein I4F81_000219 [Neopyropia yezoensis]
MACGQRARQPRVHKKGALGVRDAVDGRSRRRHPRRRRRRRPLLPRAMDARPVGDPITGRRQWRRRQQRRRVGGRVHLHRPGPPHIRKRANGPDGGRGPPYGGRRRVARQEVPPTWGHRQPRRCQQAVETSKVGRAGGAIRRHVEQVGGGVHVANAGHQVGRVVIAADADGGSWGKGAAIVTGRGATVGQGGGDATHRGALPRRREPLTADERVEERTALVPQPSGGRDDSRVRSDRHLARDA